MLAPIVVTACSRYKLLKDCLESLASCKLADKSELFIAVDYPWDSKYVGEYNKILEYLRSELSGFLKVNLIVRDKNVGYIKNMQDVFNRVFEKYDRLIYTEDDNTFSKCFLEYENTCLEYFKNDMRISCVTGFTIYRLNDPSNIHVEPGVPFWGLGIWKDRWTILNDRVNLDSFNKIAHTYSLSHNIWKASLRNYGKFIDYVLGQSVKKHDSAYGCVANSLDMRRVAPNESMVHNNGTGSGGSIHTWKNNSVNDYYDRLYMSSSEEFSLEIADDIHDVKYWKRFHRQKGVMGVKNIDVFSNFLWGLIFLIIPPEYIYRMKMLFRRQRK